MTDKIYHIYKQTEVVAHSITKDDLDKIYNPEEHEYEELDLNRYHDASY